MEGSARQADQIKEGDPARLLPRTGYLALLYIYFKYIYIYIDLFIDYKASQVCKHE